MSSTEALLAIIALAGALSRNGSRLFAFEDIDCRTMLNCPVPPGQCVIYPDPARPQWSAIGPCPDGAADASRVDSDHRSNDAQADVPVDASVPDVATSDGGDGTVDVVDAADADADVATDQGSCNLSASPYDSPCVIDEAYGVFVSPRATAADADGSRAHPFGTLSSAIGRAVEQKKRVYVCDDGTGYVEQVTIGKGLDGLQVFGGFECIGWTLGDTATRTRARLTAPKSPVLTISNLTVGLALEDFDIVAPDGANAGESSIAIVVNESEGVTLRRVKATSGKGKDGANGANGGGPANEGALAGTKGNDGHNACTASPNLGGFAVYQTCNGVPSGTSGRGGDGALNVTAGGDNGGASSSSGKGGTGEPLSGSWSCDAGRGHDGDNGTDGPGGASGAGLGSLTVAGWKGTDGSDGSPGQPGQGGGGGGGRESSERVLGARWRRSEPNRRFWRWRRQWRMRRRRRQGRDRGRFEHRPGQHRLGGDA